MNTPPLDVKSIDDLEAEYRAMCQNLVEMELDLGDWLPGFRVRNGRGVRPAMPGELVFFMAETGAGKSMCLQAVSLHCCIDPVIFFQMELPGALMFERYAAMANKMDCLTVENAYKDGGPGVYTTKLRDRIFVYDHPMITVDHMLAVIDAARKPPRSLRVNVVMVDYIGLMSAPGSGRYEKMTAAAQAMKVLAKEANVVVVAATQVGRLKDDAELTIHSARDTGAIEESADLLIGTWRDVDDPATQWLKVLKGRKGGAGTTIECNFDGAKMQITEKATNAPAGAPEWYDEGTKEDGL